MTNSLENEDLRTILAKAKKNDEQATRYLVKKYKSMIDSIINNKGYFLKNGEQADLFAEGLIGLYRAIQDFDENKGNSSNFKTNLENFFYMCINRALISAVIKSNRYKNIPLNEMTSLDRPLQDNDNLTAADIISSKKEIQDNFGFDFINPEEQLILEETIKSSKEKLDLLLSDVEKEVYELRKQKFSYKEMKEILNYDKIKPIDNALQRIKKKLDLIIEEERRKSLDSINDN